MFILGIESSCDDTSIAVVRDGVEVKASLVSSQIEIHRRFGGVVPEVASRKHLEAFPPLLQEALTTAGITISDIDQIAVTAGPGLLGSLLVGLTSAKALAWSLGKPLIPVNHLEAHLAAGFLAAGRAPEWPYLGLIVSGGHSNLVVANGPRSFEILGRTVDDAPGELFDKTARFLGLGYPGGPVIQKQGEHGDPLRYSLPRPLRGQGFGFSFSGLKTAVINLAKKEGDALSLPDLCASLQEAVADTLCGKIEAALTRNAATEAGKAGSKNKPGRRPPPEPGQIPQNHATMATQGHNAGRGGQAPRQESSEQPGASDLVRLVIAGGVAANAVLRTKAKALSERLGVELLIPPLSLCTDNAAMIAAHGFFSRDHWQGADTLAINARADWPMGGGPETIL